MRSEAESAGLPDRNSEGAEVGASGEGGGETKPGGPGPEEQKPESELPPDLEQEKREIDPKEWARQLKWDFFVAVYQNPAVALERLDDLDRFVFQPIPESITGEDLKDVEGIRSHIQRALTKEFGLWKISEDKYSKESYLQQVPGEEGYVDTDIRASDGRVAEVVSNGFIVKYGSPEEKVLRPATVRIYRYKPREVVVEEPKPLSFEETTRRFRDEIETIEQELSDPKKREHLLGGGTRLDGYIFTSPTEITLGPNPDPKLVQEISERQEQIKHRLWEEYQFRQIPAIPSETRFDYHYHNGQAGGYVYTDNPRLNGKIAEVLYPGYVRGDGTKEKVLFPTGVSVYTNNPEYKK